MRRAHSYASMDYEEGPLRETNLQCVDILVNGKSLDALAFLATKEEAQGAGRRAVEALKKTIKRQQVEVIIQAAVGAKIVARERITPFRKNVLVKSGKTVGGGDQTRKKKLLEKQKRGKARVR